jgi:hypothetical protein
VTAKHKEVDPSMERIGILYKKLRQKPNENILKCVINPDSFSKTIENIFSLSFMVQQAKVKLDQNNSNLVVSVTNKEEELKPRDVKKQGVIKLNLAIFNEMSRVIKQESTMI